MSINGVGSYHTQDYAVQKHRAGQGSSVSDFEFMGNATAPSESSGNGKAIGLTTVGNRGYIAMYAASSTEQEPIIKVGNYEVRINDVDPRNATKMEMFALMSYMDDKGLTNNQGMKSFNKMTAYSSQAEYNGFCSGIYDENTAWSMQRDWIDILGNAKSTFFGNPQTYKQGLECEKMIENLKKRSEASYASKAEGENVDYQKIHSERKSEIYEKLKHGDTEESFQIGGSSFTEKEWDKLLSQVDDITEEIKVSNFKEYETPNYKFVPEPDFDGIRILVNGQSAGVFSAHDLKIRVDEQTGTRVLISEMGGYGGAWYDAIPVDAELENGLAQAIGVDDIEEVSLEGYYIGTHAGTGIQYVMRPGDEGRGGKVLLRNAADEAKYNALAKEYYNRYPNLVTSQESGRIYASFEICGMMERTATGFVRIGYDNISYNDNSDYKKNWSVMLTGDTWELLNEWLKENREHMKELEKFSSWRDVFDEIGGSYERVWSDEELKQGYLNN